MEILGPYVHNIDPIIGQVGGLYLWWYGLGYTLGFLQNRERVSSPFCRKAKSL